jgi:hypothetical protein
MSTLLGNRLPAAVLSILATEARRQPQGQCIILVTVDSDGNARPCLLSVGEMLAVDDRTLRAVVWPGSMTTSNLDRGHPVLFVLAAPPDVFHVRATPTRLPDAPNSSLARFEFAVSSVDVDGHDGMPVTHPMWFAAREDLRDKVLAMWADQVDALQHDG